jgi:pentatricopeptide repeat protein
MHLFREIPLKGLNPAIVTYNILLKGLFQFGRCGTSIEVFSEMQLSAVKPDI